MISYLLSATWKLETFYFAFKSILNSSKECSCHILDRLMSQVWAFKVQNANVPLITIMSKAVGSHMRWWCSLARLKMSEQVKLHFTYHNFLLFWMCCKKKQWIQKLVQHIRADLKTRKHYVENFSFTDKLFLNPASFNV